MAGKEMPKHARRALYRFADKVASLVRDTRRQRFLREVIAGLVIGGQSGQIAASETRGNYRSGDTVQAMDDPRLRAIIDAWPGLPDPFSTVPGEFLTEVLM